MSLRVNVDVQDLASPLLTRLIAGLSEEGIATLHEGIVNQIGVLTTDYLTELANTRHDTAERLGAFPTGFWGSAAEGVERWSDGDGAHLAISHPGIGRAGHDVTIEPTGGRQFLTIPVAAESYGKRASEIPGLFRPGDKHVLAVNDNGLKILFALVESVTQKQDRTILPSDDQYTQAALVGVKDYVDFLLNQAA